MRKIGNHHVAGDLRLLFARIDLNRHSDRSVSGGQAGESELQRLHSKRLAMHGHALVLLIVLALVAAAIPADEAVRGTPAHPVPWVAMDVQAAQPDTDSAMSLDASELDQAA